MSLPLHTRADVNGVVQVEILKVLTEEEALNSTIAASDTLIWTASNQGQRLFRNTAPTIEVQNLQDHRVIQPGDVIRLRPGKSIASVIYRRGVASNVLFATERCNSLCLMCSQPPRDDDDSWRIAEILKLISLIDRDVPLMTISGGEPTLLGDGLGDILAACRMRLPDVPIQILSNGRTLANRAFTARLASIHHEKVTWAVPLYADVRAVHDEVVDATGAFDETLLGLYELGRIGARIEIRVVLHRLTIPRLEALASFIYRRLPFVAHIALMGLEPMGFAKTNRDRLWIDPADYQAELKSAVFHLANRGMAVSIYNLPLCVLDRSLWPFARQSISSWKNEFPVDCIACSVKDSCAGFFASAGASWRSRMVHPIAS